MIKSVHTQNVIFTTESHAEHDTKVVMTNCKLEQTAYGSIKVLKPDNSRVLELYPLSIETVIHKDK